MRCQSGGFGLVQGEARSTEAREGRGGGGEVVDVGLRGVVEGTKEALDVEGGPRTQGFLELGENDTFSQCARMCMGRYTGNAGFVGQTCT